MRRPSEDPPRLEGPRAEDKGAAVALGNFDGVHVGHQRVIADAARAARGRSGAPLGVISFEPHARMHFQPDAPPFRLMTPHQLARTVEAWAPTASTCCRSARRWPASAIATSSTRCW